MKGFNHIETGAGSELVPGYWYQKYLPADNAEVPGDPSQLVENTMPPEPYVANAMPAEHYPHCWNFIPKRRLAYRENFDRAHGFSHFGGYEKVNSRSQYYRVTLESGNVDQVVGEGENVPWLDRNDSLCVWTVGVCHCPPSMFNEHTYLKLVRREPFGLIAMHWDKRDDELDAFSRFNITRPMTLFQPVTLSSRAGLAQRPPSFSTTDSVEVEVTLSKRFKRWTPPVVQMAKVVVDPGKQKVKILFYSRTADQRDEYESRFAPPIEAETARILHTGTSNATVPDPLEDYREFYDYLSDRYAQSDDPVFPDPSQPDFTNFHPDVAIWRVTIAGFDSASDVARVFSETICDNSGAGFIFQRKSKYLYSYEWSATDSLEDQHYFAEFIAYCNVIGSTEHSTSVWFEDIIGHVSTAEKTVFRDVST
jgi:hypothetical protein